MNAIFILFLLNSNLTIPFNNLTENYFLKNISEVNLNLKLENANQTEINFNYSKGYLKSETNLENEIEKLNLTKVYLKSETNNYLKSETNLVTPSKTKRLLALKQNILKFTKINYIKCPFNSSITYKFNSVCTDCSDFYTESDIFTMCSSECFSSIFFSECMKLLSFDISTKNYFQNILDIYI